MMGLESEIVMAAVGRSVPSLFMGTGTFAKIILLILFVISMISWAIIWDRTRLYLRLRAKGNALRQAISKSGVGKLMSSVDKYMPSIEGSILVEASRYVASKRSRIRDGRIVVDTPAAEEVERAKFREVLDRRALNEISGMERHLVFLATTSAVAPFLGLLGTVWGIMTSFLSMGVQGTASIDVVGPGIAEALATTIAGLGAAIPALIGYNLLVRNVHRKETQTDLFISRVIEYCVVSDDTVSAGGAQTRSRSEASV
ncbi:MAG: MotA/TolQ/ExbB proton channel family protein [Candidatus Krumholzibacteria bacterium]|nr:MotA/TolQ/ExbB proton channel family protein [Candidatus Krumholzibacteria bacterium]